MIGLDTNVLVRYLVQDDEVQSPVATRLIDRLSPERPGYVSAIVLAETTWVLSRAYKASQALISTAVETILRSRELVVENAEAAYRALAAFQSARVEFADALIAANAKLVGCSEIVTFDKMAAEGAGMRLLVR